MPVYLNTKSLLTVPKDDESDIFDSDTYLCDPEMFFDQLPQPFRLINKILNTICNNAWSHIIKNVENRKLLGKQKCVDDVSAMMKLPCEDVIQCMCSIGQNGVMMGSKTGLTLWNIDSYTQSVVDRLSDDDMNVCSIVAYNFIENVTLVAIINEDGSTRIMAVILKRIYFIKEFSSSKDTDKPVQVTNISMDECCGTLSLSYNQIGGDEQWLEIYRINKEAWIKEIGAASKAYQEYLNTQSSGLEEEIALEENTFNESTLVLDRSGIRVSPLNIAMKMKYPDSIGVVGLSNLNQLQKQVDITGQCIGLGINHCLTKSVIDGRINASDVDGNVFFESESRLMRIAHVRYLTTVGSLMSKINNDENAAETDYAMIIVWWTQCQHLLMYGLNKTAQKDPWTNPDTVRSFSCAISACEVSHNSSFIGVGLENGLIIVINIISGLTRLVKKVSNNPIKTITFLHFQESEIMQDMNVIDQKHFMYCVNFNVAKFSDNCESTLIESDADADAVVTLGSCYDLVFSVYREGLVTLRDMFSGTIIFNIEIPLNVIISSPWSPLIALVDERYLCIQAAINEGSEDVECPSTTLLYQLDLEQFRYVDKSTVQVDQLESTSYITKMGDDYLLKRRESHNHRQNCLQECFSNLHQYLKSSIVQ